MTETPTDWQSVAAALNSQLAAERERYDLLMTAAEADARIAEQQLAAEKAKNTNLAALLDACEQQLAAEHQNAVQTPLRPEKSHPASRLKEEQA